MPNTNRTDLNEAANEPYGERKLLFNVHGYTEKQLNGDARLRIEQRLRQAGLINNDYARQIINAVQPPTVPRRDNISNNNWNGFALDNK